MGKRVIRSKVVAAAASIGLVIVTLTAAVTVSVPAPAGAAEEPWTPAQAPLPTAPLPDGGTATGMDLLSTSCSSAAFCLSVGWVSDGTDANGWSPKFPFAEAYSGGTWTPSVLPQPADAESPSGAALDSVSCGGDGACAAVGVYDSVDADEGYQNGLLEVLSGGVWTDAVAPLPGGPDSALVNLNSVSCSDPLTCVAVGTEGPDNGNPNVGLIYQLDGGVWSLQTVPVPAGSNEEDLHGVACPDDGDCTAVGDWLDQDFNWHPLVLTGTAGVWSQVTVPAPSNQNPGGGQLLLSGVDCPEVSTCVVGGSYYDTNNYGQPLLLEEQAGVWSVLEAPLPAGAPADPNGSLAGVYCPAAGTCTATGTYEPGGTGSSPAGMILTLAAGSWSAQPAPLPPGVPGAESASPALKPGLATSVQNATSPSTSASLGGVGCGVDGFCASGGQVGTGGGLLETGGFSDLPTVSGLTPSSGPLSGGTSVTVDGTNFGTGSVASFGGKAVATTVVSPTELVATAPVASVAGRVNVTVTTGGLQTRAAPYNEYSYVGAQNRIAGYTRTAVGTASQSAAVTFWVPAAACSSVTKGGFQVVNEGAQLLTGAGDTFGGVSVACVGTKATYGVVAGVNGLAAQPALTVTAGAKVTVAATESAGAASVTVTTAKGQQIFSGAGGTVTAAGLGTMAANCSASTCAPVPRMTVTSFETASIDGQTPTAAAASLVNLQDAAGATEVLAAKTGAASSATFKATWKLSCSKAANC